MRIEIMKVKMANMPSKVVLPPNFKETALSCADNIKANPGQGRKSYQYVTFFQDYDGEILQTIYSVKYDRPRKKGDVEKARTQLVFAGTPTRKWTSGNLLYSRLSGYFVLWDKTEGRTGFVHYYGFDPCMYKAYDNDWIPGIANIAEKDPIEGPAELLALRNWPKYMDVTQMMNDCGVNQILRYCQRFVNYPELERLQKSGLSYLWDSNYILNSKPKAKKRLLTYIKNNIVDIRARHPEIGFILAAMRRGMTIAQYEWQQVVDAVDGVLCGVNGYFMHEQAAEVAKYLQKQNGGPIHYRDYLEASAKIGRNLDDRGVLFPKDFCKQFDEIQKTIAEMEKAEATKRLALLNDALAKKKLKDVIVKGGFRIVVPSSYEELVDLGNKLHNCVGTCGYGERMADGSILILAVYKDGNPLSCVEVAMPGTVNNSLHREYASPTVVQNRGDHNKSVSDEVKVAVQTYVTRFKRAYKAQRSAA